MDQAAIDALIQAALTPLRNQITTLQADLRTANTTITRQEQQINNANAAIAAAAAANAPAAGGTATAFARTPAQAHTNLLDYQTSTGSKVYKAASTALKTPFDHKEPNVRNLLTELSNRAKANNWHDILQINVAPAGQPANNVDLIERYGMVTKEQVKAKATSFIDQQNRNAQNDWNLYETLINTVVPTTSTHMSSNPSRYKAGTRNTESGILYLKVLLDESEASSRALVSSVQGNLQHLADYMRENARHDIQEFNDYVNAQLALLTTRKAADWDDPDSFLMTNLWSGYKACQDFEFHADIRQMKSDFDAGRRPDLKPSTLMALALQKYQDRKIDKNEQWLSPTEREKQMEDEIVTLRAQVEGLKHQRPKTTTGTTKTRPGSPKSGPSSRTKKHKVKGPKSAENQSWKKVPPKEGEPHTKVVQGTTFYFCRTHGWNTSHYTEQKGDVEGCRALRRSKRIRKPTVAAAMAQVGVTDIKDTDSSGDEGMSSANGSETNDDDGED